MCCLLLIMAALCLIYYGILALYAGMGTTFIWFWLMAGLCFGALSVLAMLQKHTKFLNRIPGPILGIAGATILAGVVLVLFLFGCVLSKMWAKPQKAPDYIIILGAQIRGEWITKPLRFRLDAALDYYEEVAAHGTRIIVSGGQGTGETISESLAMKRYLMQRGVEEDRILMEEQSTTTKENLEYSYQMICEEKGEDCQVVICSNNFHIFRALQLAKHLGMKQVEGLAAKCDPLFLPNYMIRDSLAIFKEFLLGNIGLGF